jgi:hypothetical protein
MFLIKGWTQTCVQNLIKIPLGPVTKDHFHSLASGLAADGRCLGRSSACRSDLSQVSVQKRNPTSPSLDKTQPESPSPAFNIRSLRGVDKNSDRLHLLAIFFQHQFGLIFFPPHIRSGDGPGYGAMVGLGKLSRKFQPVHQL